MSENGFGNGGHCPECDGNGGKHYPGCTYEGTGSEGHHSSGSGNGISTMGAIFCVIASFVGAALVFTLLGVDVENVPVIVILIVIVVIASILGAIGNSRKW